MNMQIHTLYGSGVWDERFEQSVRFLPGETENKEDTWQGQSFIQSR